MCYNCDRPQIQWGDQKSDMVDTWSDDIGSQASSIVGKHDHISSDISLHEWLYSVNTEDVPLGIYLEADPIHV